jgi:probable HAF family extracellular repeat protein
LVLAPILVQAQKQHAFIWSSATGMQDIGTLGGDSSYATGINDRGQVVGWSYLADNTTSHGFIWTLVGGMVDLGKPNGPWSQAFAINSAGELTGQVAWLGPLGLPFYWSPGSRFELIGKRSQEDNDFGFAINDFSEVTGQFYTSDDVVHAFVWSPKLGEPVPIGTLPGGLHTVGNAISNRHHITGTGSTGMATYDAFVWSKENGMRDIGAVVGGSYTAGEGINDRDEVVGIGFDNAGRILGFYWSPSTGMKDLQTLGGVQSACFSINQSGSFAGYSTNVGGFFHAALWADHTSVPQDLGTLPGGANSYAQGINNLGQVVGLADAP